MLLALLCSDLPHYKVPGRHDTEAGGVIWEVTDSRAGGGVACRHPGGSAAQDGKSCLERLEARMYCQHACSSK